MLMDTPPHDWDICTSALPENVLELFPGSKLFVVIDETMSAGDLCSLAYACYDDMPISKPRRKKGVNAASEEKRQAEIEKMFPFAKHLR